jgi:hypothetical protein
MQTMVNLYRDHLVAGLHERGLCYLAPTPIGDEPALSDDELLLGLATTEDSRLRFALAGLLLLRPSLAERIAMMIEHAEGLPADAVASLKKQYLAAMYLQRLWRTRLQIKFGPRPFIPERYVAEQHLPSPDELFGERGLLMLCQRSPYNDWSSYEQVIELLMQQPCVEVDMADMVLDSQYLQRQI